MMLKEGLDRVQLILKYKVDILSGTPFIIQKTNEKMVFFRIFSTSVRLFENNIRSRVRIDSKLLCRCFQINSTLYPIEHIYIIPFTLGSHPHNVRN